MKRLSKLESGLRLSSVLDETPEGRSVIEYVQAKSISYNRELAEQGEFVPFKSRNENEWC